MVYCCVPFCKSNSKKKTPIAFHEFPSDYTLTDAWLRAICRKDYYPKDHAVVCSLHFKKDDYVPNLKYRKLKPNTVPSIFPGYPSWHKVAPLPKVVYEESQSSHKRPLYKCSSSILPKCKPQSTTSADLKTLTVICTEVPVSKVVHQESQSSQKCQLGECSSGMISNCKHQSTPSADLETLPVMFTEVPLPKVVYEESQSSQKRQLGESDFSMLPKCKRQRTPSASLKALPGICTEINESNLEQVDFRSPTKSEMSLSTNLKTLPIMCSEINEPNLESVNFSPPTNIEMFQNADLSNLPIVISASINEQNFEPVNFRSTTKTEKSHDELYEENRRLKNQLYSKNKEIASLKEKVTIINEKLECYEKECCLACVKKIQLLECKESAEKSRNEPQKILFLTSGTSDSCVDEADTETILNTVIEHSEMDYAETGHDQRMSNEAMPQIAFQISDKSAEKSRNEPQKILFLTSGTSNICVDEADTETILDTVIEHSDTNDAETGRDQCRSNAAMSETALQISNIQGNITSNNSEMNHQCTTSTIAIKKKVDVIHLQSATEKTITITKEPKEIAEVDTCNCKKNELDGYAAKFATKLRNMDEQFRDVVMNEIDKMISNMQEKHSEGLQFS